MTRIRYLILVLCCSLSSVLYLHRYTWGIIKKSVQDDFGWDNDTLGWLDSCFPLTYGIGSIPSGIACDWFGARLFLVLIALLWALSLGWTSIATTTWGMAASRLSLGLTQSGCYPTLGKISKNWFPRTNRTFSQSLITASGRLGGAAAFVVVPILMVSFELSWRSSLAVLTLLGVALAMVVFLLFGNSPREHRWANQKEADYVTSADPVALHTSGSVLSWQRALRSYNMWLLLGRAFFSNLADFVYIYWIPYYFLTVKQTNLHAETLGASMLMAGLYAALPLLGGAAGGICSGWTQDRIMRRVGSRRWARSGIGFSSKFLAMGFILGSLYFQSPTVIAWMLFTVKFFGDWEGPVTWGTATDIGGKNSATVFGLINTMGSIAAVLAGPITVLIISTFSDSPDPEQFTIAGWNALFVIMALEYLSVAVIWLFIDCTVPIEPEEQSEQETTV